MIFPLLRLHHDGRVVENPWALRARVCHNRLQISGPRRKESARRTDRAAWWVDQAQEWARAAGVQGVIRSLLPAIIATGDIQFTLDDYAAIWLDPYRASGRAVDAQAWRKILNGSGDLITPTPIKTMVDGSIGHVPVQATW
jgi:hypothetical protein